MDVRQHLIIDTARQNLGTPWQHQGRLPGIGLDCIGLVCVVADVLGVAYSDRRAYHRLPRNGELEAALELNLIKIDAGIADPGDIFLMNEDGVPQHVGILTDYGIIHATNRIGRVVETVLDDTERAKISNYYRFPA